MKAFFMLCRGEGCPIKEYCIRYTDPIEKPAQAFQVPPYNHQRKSCEAFEETEPDVLKELLRISNYEEKRDPFPGK